MTTPKYTSSGSTVIKPFNLPASFLKQYFLSVDSAASYLKPAFSNFSFISLPSASPFPTALSESLIK